jgi:hypothetical protein
MWDELYRVVMELYRVVMPIHFSALLVPEVFEHIFGIDSAKEPDIQCWST